MQWHGDRISIEERISRSLVALSQRDRATLVAYSTPRNGGYGSKWRWRQQHYGPTFRSTTEREQSRAIWNQALTTRQFWLPNSGIMSSTGQQRPAMVWLMDFLGR